jgi:PiT family inorganic phosphate transporter
MLNLDPTLLIAIASALALFVSCGVGANDVANAMGTSVGARVLTIRQAIVLAAVFEGLGALLASNNVTETISKGVFNLSYFNHQPEILFLGMFAALLAVGSWLVLATYSGWPVSTTHSIIGALLGFGLLSAGPSNLHWHIISFIFGSWIVTPFIAGVLSFLLFNSVRKLIIESRNPASRALLLLPVYIFLVTAIILWVVLNSSHPLLQKLNIELMPVTLLVASLITLCAWFWLRIKIRVHKQYKIEPMFGVLAIFTACAMAFAHGSNDTANAIGPAVTMIHLIDHSVAANAPPVWLTSLGAFGVMAGLAIYGYRVISTIGSNITELTPSRSFAAQLATALTVILASSAGLPVSTTQILIGGILGVGLARGIAAINMSVVRTIFLSWIITIPAGASLSCVFFLILKQIFIQ